MKEKVWKKFLKLVKVGLIYLISDGASVSPVQVVFRKGGMIVVHNEMNDLIQTHAVTG